jgi:hypothetical protein
MRLNNKNHRTTTTTAALRNWCPLRESDPRPLPYQGSALPLSQKGENLTTTSNKLTVERGRRIELLALAWKAKVLPLYEPRTCSTLQAFLGLPLTYHWWRGLDSNQRTRKRADLQSAAINHSATSPKVNPGLCHQIPGAVHRMKEILCVVLNFLSGPLDLLLNLREPSHLQVVALGQRVAIKTAICR